MLALKSAVPGSAVALRWHCNGYVAIARPCKATAEKPQSAPATPIPIPQFQLLASS
jgi:hypothetical protein